MVTAPPIRSRFVYVGLLLLTIFLGLASRHFSYRLPPLLSKNAGDILYATMTFWLAGLLLPRMSIMKILIVSSSLDQESRSERVARLCGEALGEGGVEANFLSLKDHVLPPFGKADFSDHPVYRFLHAEVLRADGLVLASPVYNWSSCAELKKFIEYIGATNGTVRGAFYDKVVTFVHAAGLPHSYMAAASLATAMMLDFKCVINPYSVYVHDQHWQEDTLTDEAMGRIRKSMAVMDELTLLLSQRTYRSDWEI